MMIRTRVSLLSMLVVTVALGAFGWTVFQATRSGVLAEIQQDVKGRARAIAASIEVDADGPPRAPTLDVFSTPDTYAEVTTTGGDVLQRSSNLPDRGGQDHSGRVGNTGRRDEIGQLTTTIDAMLQALENSHRDIQHANQTQRRFLADVSHELRTPLTIMLSSLELVDKVGGTDPDFRQGALDDMGAEVQRMARMVTQLLIMARSGTNATAANRPLLIGEVVADVCR